jgi:hypothetical protein
VAETVKAIREWLKVRPEPKDAADAGLVVRPVPSVKIADPTTNGYNTFVHANFARHRRLAPPTSWPP